MKIPADPRELFEEFLPRQLEGRRVPVARIPAALAVRVRGVGDWSIVFREGRLSVESGLASPTVVQLSIELQDWEPLVAEPLGRLASAYSAHPESASADGGSPVGALLSRMARWDQETVDLLRQQTGSVEVAVRQSERRHRLLVTPGRGEPSFDAPRCTVSCDLEDLVAVQEGRQNPLDLLYGGRLQIAGDAQIAVALAGLLI